MSKLPTELIVDIFSRLPVKSLLRFRCVSKPWSSRIDGPDFIKMHIDRSIKTKYNLTLILGGTGTLYSLDFDSLKKTVKLYTPFNNSVGDVVGSCNGLLLLQRDEISLFNPSTRKYQNLPATPVQYPNGFVRTAFETYGFGYDPLNNDYKVLRVVEFKGRNYEWISSEAKVYSMKSNSWRKIKDFPYCLPFKRVWGVYLNGALHTVVNRNRDPDSPRLIVCFDFGAENYYLVPLPDFSDNSFYDMFVEVLGGCLCIRAIYDGSRTDIWVMKEYGVKGSWIKLLSIAPPVVEPYVTVYALAYSKCGGKVLINFDDKRLIWYDLRRKTVRNARVRGLPNSFYAEVCVGSLVPVNGCGKIDEIKEEPRQEKTEGKKSKKRDNFLSEGFKLKL